MSFTWKRPEGRLMSPEDMMRVIIRVADELGMPDKRGAAVCAGMCVAQESDFWRPWNAADPESRNYPFDSQSDDGRSVGLYQQQKGPSGELWWGPTSQEMDPYLSTKEFLTRLKKVGYNASNAQSANDAIQAVQRSGVPDAYAKHWDAINSLYDSVIGGAPPPPPPPQPASYGLPTGSNSGGYGGNGVRFPDWVYQLGNAFGVKPSTYPGHQESDRNEAGYAPNPAHLNRAIDWAGSVDDMTRFADYLATIPQFLEQVIWQNPNTGRSIEVAGGRHQPGYFRDDLAGHRDHVHTRQSRPIPLPGGAAPPATPKPAFTQIDRIGNGFSARTRPPINWLLHTEEGSGTAESLAKFCDGSNDVSYHWTLRDGILCRVVDTKNASWSVLSANAFTINLCFAGSFAGWSRDQWLLRERDIEIAAYIAVQDCHQYGIPLDVIAPPYGTARPGISDHKYVTEVLNIGTHTDVGANFPWDVFATAVRKYANPTQPLPGDDMALVPQEQWDRVFRELTDLRTSRSPLREPDEGPKDTWSGFGLNTDSSQHLEICKLLAGYGHPPTIALLKRVAAMPVNKPGREGDCLIARAILADVTAAPVTTTVVNNVAPAAATVAPADTRELDAAYAENARLREENTRLLAEAAQLRADAAVSTAIVPIAADTRTSGDRVGQLVDSVEDWTDLALSMDVKQRAALAASIKVLEMEKNGSQL